MLAKLMKYEFKATARVFVPLYAAVLVVSAVSKLMIGLQLQTPHIISMVLSILLIVAAFVMTLVLTVQRFYKNFLTDEGYLMFTLPVGTGRMINGKLLVAVIWNVVCTAVAFLSLSLIAFSGDEWRQITQAIGNLGLPSADLTLFIIEFCALILASLVTSILTIYASMALSMLANKHRVALSFAFYIALNTVMQILLSVVLLLFGNPSTYTDESFQVFIEQNALGAIHACALVTLAVTIAFGAAMFFTTRYMLKNQLNLQ